MNSDKLYNIIDEAIIVASHMKQGTYFTELSTYFKNHIPGITDQEIEVLRDVLMPIQRKAQELINIETRTRLRIYKK